MVCGKKTQIRKKYVFFSRIRGRRILAYIAVTIHYKKIIDNSPIAK